MGAVNGEVHPKDPSVWDLEWFGAVNLEHGQRRSFKPPGWAKELWLAHCLMNVFTRDDWYLVPLGTEWSE